MKSASLAAPARVGGTRLNACEREPEQLGERQRQALLDQDAQDAERMRGAAPNGSLSPVGSCADAEQCRPASRACRRARRACATGAARQRVAGEARPVVLRDRVGDFGAARRRAARSSGPSMPCSSGNSPTMSVTGRPWRAARRGRRSAAVGADARRRCCRRARARARRGRLACRACCGRRRCASRGTRDGERLLAVLVEEELAHRPGAARTHALVAADDRAPDRRSRCC